MTRLALLIIDMQKEYEPDGKLPVNHLDRVKKNVIQLLEKARGSDDALPIHVQHISPDPNDSDFVAGTKGVEFMDEFKPKDGEFTITKHFADAFSNPDLEKYLQENDIKTVIVCGLTSILCCDTTCRVGNERGFDMKYVSDAISEFDLESTTGDQAHAYVDEVQSIMFSEVIDTKKAIELM